MGAHSAWPAASREALEEVPTVEIVFKVARGAEHTCFQCRFNSKIRIDRMIKPRKLYECRI
jgi:hypothetical protein